jgi:uncharacterized protein (TIGR03437 family)
MRRVTEMQTFIAAIIALALSLPALAQMPQYSAETVISEASQQPGPFAPYSLVTIRGRDLAWAERLRTESDSQGGLLPLILTGTSVTVSVSGLAATVERVSPESVTFLMPVGLRPGRAEVRLIHAGRAGPGVPIQLVDEAPAVYMWSPGVVLARDAESYEWVEPGRPALPGDEVVVYATGLGVTNPTVEYRRIVMEPREIAARDRFTVWLNDLALDDDAIAYVGVMPGWPGLYEVRFRLPEDLPSNPVVRLQIGELLSQDEVRLALSGYDHDWGGEEDDDPGDAEDDGDEDGDAGEETEPGEDPEG